MALALKRYRVTPITVRTLASIAETLEKAARDPSLPDWARELVNYLRGLLDAYGATSREEAARLAEELASMSPVNSVVYSPSTRASEYVVEQEDYGELTVTGRRLRGVYEARVDTVERESIPGEPPELEIQDLEARFYSGGKAYYCVADRSGLLQCGVLDEKTWYTKPRAVIEKKY